MSSGVSWSALRASCRDTVSSVMPGCCFELCPSSVVPGCCFVPCSVLRVSGRALSFEHRAALPFERRAGLLLEFCSSSVMPGCCFELFFSKHQPACRTGMYRAACRGLPFDSVPGYYFERNAVVLLRALPFECNAVVLLRALPFECRAGLLLRTVLCPSSIVPRSICPSSIVPLCPSSVVPGCYSSSTRRVSCRDAAVGRALPSERRFGLLLRALLFEASARLYGGKVSSCVSCSALRASCRDAASSVMPAPGVLLRAPPFEVRVGLLLRPVLCPSSIVPSIVPRSLRASGRAAARALPVGRHAGMLLRAVLCPPSVVPGCCFELLPASSCSVLCPSSAVSCSAL